MGVALFTERQAGRLQLRRYWAASQHLKGSDTPTGEKLEGSDAHTEEAEKTHLQMTGARPRYAPAQRDPGSVAADIKTVSITTEEHKAL